MLKLSLFSLSGLSLFIAAVPLVYLVAKELNKNKKLFPFLMYQSCMLLWGIGAFTIGFCSNPENATAVWKWAYAPVIFVPIFFYHSILNFNNLKKGWFLWVIYLQGLIFLILHLTGNLFLPAEPVPFSAYHIKSTPLATLHIFVAWMIIKVLGHVELFKLHQKSINKKHNLFLLMSTPIGFMGGILNYLPIYDVPCYPVGNILVGIYIGLCTYGILQHQLLNIYVFIKKSLIYTVLIAIISIIYLTFVVISERFLQNFIGYQSIALSGLLTFGIGLLFIPLKNSIEKFVNNYFFQGSPQELSEQIQKYSIQAQESDKYKMAAKLAGNVAHEIKNPLTAIRTFVEQFPHKKNDQEFLDKFQKLASTELTRIHNLSLQLMDFAKPAELKLSTFDVHQILDDVFLLTNQRLKNQNVRLDKHFAFESLTLTGDQDQLKQVFLNLILNAVDAMENGGTLTVGTHLDTHTVGANPCIRPIQQGQTHGSAPTSNDTIKIIITDTGSGITPENLKKLFEPFFTTKHDGTGLGLSICKRIIENHGGMIEVKSIVNKGTTFSIILPTGKAGKTVQT